MDIKIIVATHKAYWMPDDPVYMPVQVGRAHKADLGYTGDDTGDNISDRNANYCELTGLYWAWKNLDAEYIGLAHYRRHFRDSGRFGDKRSHVIGRVELEKRLVDCDILLPRPRHYWIETNYSQYAHSHNAIDLDTAREVLRERHPDYVPAFDAVMKRVYGHRFNMFVMKRDILDGYCAWLFDTLFSMEKRLDISAYSPNDARVFGFVGERLMDVWLEKNRVAYRELPCMFMERQNWLIKGGNFLVRKMGRKEGLF